MSFILKFLHKHRILLLPSYILIFFIPDINGFADTHSHGEYFYSRFRREIGSLSTHDCSPPEASPGTNYEDVRKNLIRMRCDNKFIQKISGSSFLSCMNSQWTPKNTCILASSKPDTPRIPLSKPTTPPTVQINSSQSIKHDCIPPKPSNGTSYDDIRHNIIRIRCAQNYIQQSTSSPFIPCINGQWSSMQICIYHEPPAAPVGNYAGCGILHELQPLVVDGKNAVPAEHPWNAGLYRRLKNGKMEFFCGGSLITPYSILTAAHCTEGRTRPQYIARYKVVLGKKFRQYDEPTEVNTAQYIDVDKVYQSELYEGENSRFVADIAIWELKTAVQINTLILPVCIDLDGRNILKTDMTGKVAGWGKTSEKQGSESDILQEAVIKYKTNEDCIKHLDGGNRSNLAIDKSCTTIERGNVHVVQGGDSGAGYVFEIGGRHYVYGIVSLNIKSTVVSAFTNLATQSHLDFIKRVLKEISNNKTPQS